MIYETGVELISKERAEQIEKHGHTPSGDMHNDYLIVLAKYLLMDDDDAEKQDVWDQLVSGYNVDFSYMERLDSKTYREKLTIAGALIAAELDADIYRKI